VRCALLSSPPSWPPWTLPSVPTRRSSDLGSGGGRAQRPVHLRGRPPADLRTAHPPLTLRDQHRRSRKPPQAQLPDHCREPGIRQDRKSTRLNSSHVSISYAVFCLKKKRDI